MFWHGSPLQNEFSFGEVTGVGSGIHLINRGLFFENQKQTKRMHLILPPC
uniref:Uncharacterized protein n=1 Tax=Anguilla anguilla TaxID=7936 RepID=A0A0E9RAZ6_ANGAN